MDPSLESVLSQREQQPLDEEWVSAMKGKLEQVDGRKALVSDKVFMCRIPKHRREGKDRDAYVPRVISLGPYYFGGTRYKDMENHKWVSLSQILKRYSHDLEMYLNSVKEVEEQARACYQGTDSFNSNEFVQMMVLDGCFILEALQGSKMGFKEIGYPANDPVFSSHGLMRSIRSDMILLENQLPWFILERLYNLREIKQRIHLRSLILRFFDPLLPSHHHPSEVYTPDFPSHLTKGLDSQLNCFDVFRQNLLPNNRRGQERVKGQIRCVIQLRETGIELRRRKIGSICDIRYTNGILHIPQLKIHDGTKSLFLNLIVYEQSFSGCSKEISAYVNFMRGLIHSSNDMAYLSSRGIIEHSLKSDMEVVELFKQLCQEVALDVNDDYYFELILDMEMAIQKSNWNRIHWNRFCRNWGHSLTILRDKYFNNRWAFISFLGAVFLIILTFVQTFYGVYSYYNPR